MLTVESYEEIRQAHYRDGKSILCQRWVCPKDMSKLGKEIRLS